MTDRLYLQDAFLDRFEATVLEQRQLQGKTAVRLDQSAFYPESGGQMADRGQLGSHGVIDVQIDDTLHVWHLLDSGSEAILGQRLAGSIDMQRGWRRWEE